MIWAKNIGKLINEVYLADLQKNKRNWNHLHAQINPHFLYNTLSSISRLARFGMLDKAAAHGDGLSEVLSTVS